jgi:hypothetical protein
MEVTILGTGCYNCLKMEMTVARLLEELDLSGVQLTRMDDLHQIRKFIPVEETPALVINGRLVSSGRLPDEAEVRRWLGEAGQLEQQNAT